MGFRHRFIRPSCSHFQVDSGGAGQELAADHRAGATQRLHPASLPLLAGGSNALPYVNHPVCPAYSPQAADCTY